MAAAPTLGRWPGACPGEGDMSAMRGGCQGAARLLATLSVLVCLALLPACETAPPERFTNSLGMEFRLIPAGEFRMGSSQQDLERMARDFQRATGREYRPEWRVHLGDEMPAHQVEITRPFYLQRREVTNDQFARFIKETGYRTVAEIKGGGWTYGLGGWRPLPGADWRHPLGPGSTIQGKGGHPVVQVSWLDVQAFIKWLNKKESRPYALPSEAQWEYACRGGRNDSPYWWGPEMKPPRPTANMPDEAYARQAGGERYHVQGYDDGHAGTAPVGSYQANQFGLHDMIGNVWEWCADWYGPGYYASSPRQDPTGPATGRQRVMRGGCFCYLPSNLRCTDRFHNRPGFRSPFTGFRLALPAS